jgi:hypothetical protein
MSLYELGFELGTARKTAVLSLRVLDYTVTIAFGYILNCGCCNLYCGCFNLFCNVWVCVCVCFVMCGCVYVWVFVMCGCVNV